MKVEFKSRRKPGAELVEEARAARTWMIHGVGPTSDGDEVIRALKDGKTVSVHLATVPARHPATGIGE